MKKTCLLILLVAFCWKIGFAQKGKNGVEVVNTINTLVNEYTTLAGDASSGNTSITVIDNTLNSNGRFPGPLSAGDLVMIIQMQGATIDGIATDSAWGAITDYGNCGLYEFKQVASISGSTTINLQCPLQNNYSASGNVQVIRVQRYTSLTVNSGGVLTCDAWNGATGGVLALEVSGNTIINSGGVINATGTGFRGGAVQNASTPADILKFAVTTADSSGQKGESIAGYQSGYNIYGGMFGRGAPANGGGGGNSANSAGGGGANAGIGKWTGNGNPDTSTHAWDSAWNLEYTGFDTSASSGGGRGGYGTAWGFGTSNSHDPLSVPPFDPRWDEPYGTGNDRPNVGGKGGRPLDYSSGRLFLGGGGGAGQENDNVGTNGTNGGGIIYLLSFGAVSGDGNITSNGSDNLAAANHDGSGGTVVLNSTGSITGISITANGGTGGSQDISSVESEGPGGGGGGGYIATSNGGITCTALGGANGTTNSTNMVLFPPDGATYGGAGLIDTAANFCTPQLNSISGSGTVCSGSSNTYYVSAITCGAATLYTWTLPSGWNGTSTKDSIIVIAGDTGGIISVSVNNGSCPSDTSITVLVNPAPPLIIVPASAIFCSGLNATLKVAGGGSDFTWSPASGLSVTTGDSVVAGPTVSTTYTITGTDSAGCAATGSVIVTVVPSPNKPSFTQHGDTLISSSIYDNQWYRNDTLLMNDTSQHLIITKPGEYWVIVNNEANGCSTSSDSMEVTLEGISQVSIIANQLSIYPDPFNNDVYIKINSSVDDVKDWSLQITDVLGRNRYSQQSLNYSNEIELYDLASGMYFITVVNKMGRAVFPVVKQN